MCNAQMGHRRLVETALAAMCCLAALAPRPATPQTVTDRAAAPVATGLEGAVAFDIAPDDSAFIVTVPGLVAAATGDVAHTFAAFDAIVPVDIAVHPQYPMVPYVYLLHDRQTRYRIERLEADPSTAYRVAAPGSTTTFAASSGRANAIEFDAHGTLLVDVTTAGEFTLDRFDGLTGDVVEPSGPAVARPAEPAAQRIARDGSAWWLDRDGGTLWRAPVAATKSGSAGYAANVAATPARGTDRVATRDGSPSQHALGDAYWARLARDAKPFDTAAALARASRAPVQVGGNWGPVIGWPHIAVSAANLPDGRILTFASNQTTSFPVGPEFTHAATWDPKTGNFVINNHGSHDMFCGHLVMLEDGRVFINGGRNTVRLTSSYDYTTDNWITEAQQVNGRWYPTTVALPDGRVFTAVGSGGGQYPDVWTPGSGWSLMTGIDFNVPILNYSTELFGERHWWPFLHVKPDGGIFHSGPTPKLHEISAVGQGSITQVGPEIWDWYPKHSGVVMYDVGKVLIAGGWVSGTNAASSPRSLTVDFNGPTPTVTEIAPMNFARKFQNAVMLPTGDVLIVGGNTSGLKFDDTGAVLEAELWEPDTGTWTILNPMSVPRTYHSIALLMTDGRVLSAGSGLAGNPAVDHDDGQVFSPPYLYDSNGNAAVRPAISAGPAVIDTGGTYPVTASTGVTRFTMIKMSATTHAMNTDLRFVEVDTFSSLGGGNYSLTFEANGNVLTPGYWMLFALNANEVPSEAHVVQVLGSGAPVVTNPGDQTHFVGDAVSLSIDASDPTGETLSYSASGLPSGLSINGASGLIDGTTDLAGLFHVGVSVTDGNNVTAISFDWRVLTPGQGTLVREWWTDISGIAVSALLADPRFPDSPDGADTPPSFEAPTNWAVNYGTRMRGLLYPPVSGLYTFWIASDDNGELWLSSDGSAGNAALIANVPGWTTSRDWTKYPEQQSVSIPLSAGQAYYIEALQKQGGGGDNLAVAWQMPGGSVEVIDSAYMAPPDPGQFVEIVAIDAGFDGGADGFGYIDDAFRGTNQPAYADGSYDAAGGASGGGLRVDAGGVDGADITGMSGGWVHTFEMSMPAVVTLSLKYALTIDAGYEPDEYGEALAALNGSLVGTGPDASLAQLFGDGNGGDPTSTGWQVFTTQIALGAGTHTLVVGGYNNQKTVASELTVARFDDVRVSWFEPGPNAPPVLTEPADQVGIVGDVVSLTLTASDPDDDPLEFDAVGLPVGLSIAAATGQISGTLNQAGTYTVDASVDDGRGGTDAVTFDWTVGNPLALSTMLSTPQVLGADVPYMAMTTGGVNVQYKWFFGDGTPETAWSPSPSITHAFANPGRYLVTLTVTDDTAIELQTTFWQSIHEPLTAGKPSVSSTIAYETRNGGDRVWSVNPDNASVAVIDVVGASLVAQIPVESRPRSVAVAPDGRIWVVNKGSDSISVIDTGALAVVDVIALPRASQPHGLIFDGAGLNAYLVLEATGRLLALDPTSGVETASVDVGPHPRHVAIDAGDQNLYVSRFQTPLLPGEHTASVSTEIGGVKFGGEIVVVSTAGLAIGATLVLEHSNAVDSENAARGIPNYLGALAISPDGLSAWVPSKQDNVKRGVLRDGQPLTHDSTVRAILSRIDIGAGGEDFGARIDHDDASIVSAATHGAWGNWVFCALEGNREVAAVDAYAGSEVYRFDVGRAPQGVVVSPDGLTLFVHNFLDRSVSIHDLSKLVIEGDLDVTLIATVTTVASESLAPDVLLGKQLFYDARDPRLAREKYMACAACHNDGGGDGRVWDFTGFGEGLRNTISLNGHGDHGMLHWTANFDEVQDFEGQIRTFGGTGLMDDADFNNGTVSDPLGDAKTGLSVDLDALAAFVESLTSLPASPHRDALGALTPQGVAGRVVFDANGCAACHGGPGFTDSGTGGVHDIGTIKPPSGQGLGAPLVGFDTPSLRGVWATAPWLHDGSAATLADAVTAHDGVAIAGADLDALVAFVRQIDESEPEVPLNNAPTLANPGTLIHAEGETVSVDLSTLDPDGDDLAYAATGLPPGASLAADTGLVTGQLTTAGDYEVTLSVDDGRGGVDETTFDWSVTTPADTDGDGVVDWQDNCSLLANPDQRDTNGDGFGNLCDADLNDDGQVNFADLAQMKSVFLTADAHADLDGNGLVNFADLARMKSLFMQPPGPAGLL